MTHAGEVPTLPNAQRRTAQAGKRTNSAPPGRRAARVAAAELLRAGQLSVDEICAMMGIGRTMFYRYLTPAGDIRKEPLP